MRRVGTFAIAIAAALVWASPLLAAPGDLDKTFGGGDGKVTYGYLPDDRIYAVALQRDGRTVAVGETQGSGSPSSMAVLRLKKDGSLDSSFASAGKLVSTDLPSARGVAVRDDGKILVVGSAAAAMKVVRLTSGGTIDQTFGSGGSVTNQFGGVAFGDAIALLPDGRFLVAAERYLGNEIILARYLPDGAPDPSFGVGGSVIHPLDWPTIRINAMTVLPSGKIAVAGSAENDMGVDSILEVVFASNGTPDTGFGPDGARTYPLGVGDTSASQVLPDPPAGTILICRSRNAAQQTHYSILRIGPTGLVLGSEVTDLNVDGRPHAGAARADGKLVVAGAYGSSFGILQYTPSLQLDASFGDGGIARAKLTPSALDEAFGVAVQGDGKIIAGGQAPQTPPLSAPDFAFARFEGYGTPLLADQFSSGGLNWIQVKGSWTKSGGYLATSTATTARIDTPATWSPSGASSCSQCTILTTLGFLAGGTTTKLTVFAWNQSATNRVSLVYVQRTGKWMLKQQANGSSIRRRVKWPISQLYPHDIGLSYDGSDLRFMLDGKPLIRMHAIAAPSGNMGVQIANGTISIDDVMIY
jgi:uncharacterized delta-60 repeat protein